MLVIPDRIASQAVNTHDLCLFTIQASCSPYVRLLWHRLLGRPVSECGRLCRGDGHQARATAAGRCECWLFVAADRSAPHSTSEMPPQDCTLEDGRATASDPCSEVAQDDWRHHAAGERA